MIKANFSTYASYVTDSLYQWDINQVLSVTGLNLTVAPEVHFSNTNTDRAIVRQADMIDHVVKVGIPNSLLQEPFTIHAHVGIYEGATFKVVERIEIPVIARKRPADYAITDADDEIYSFNALENAIANIIAANNDTNGNSELVDMRRAYNGAVYVTAGNALRTQIRELAEKIATLNAGGLELSDALISETVQAWLSEHPEVTTTVQDGSLTGAKFSDELKRLVIKDYITPQMFGAVGDGETDDTAAIQAALAQLKSGGTLFFPRGTYIVSETLKPTVSNITIRGEYSNIKAANGNDIAVWEFENLFNVNVENLASGNTVDAQTWIKATSTHHLHVKNCATDGMKLGFDLNNCYWTKIESVRMQSIYQAFKFANNVNAFLLANISVYGAGIPSTIYDCTGGGSITGCSFERESGAIKIEKCCGISISGNYFEGYGFPEYYLSIGTANYTDTTGISVSGNIFYDGAECGIIVYRMYGLTVHGNHFRTRHAVSMYTYDNSAQKNISYLGNYHYSAEDGATEFVYNGKPENASMSPEYKFPLVFAVQEQDCGTLDDGELAIKNKSGKLQIATPRYGDMDVSVKRQLARQTFAASEVVECAFDPVKHKCGTIFVYGADNSTDSALFTWFVNENNNAGEWFLHEIYNTIGVGITVSNNKISIKNENTGNKYMVAWLNC